MKFDRVKQGYLRLFACLLLQTSLSTMLYAQEKTPNVSIVFEETPLTTVIDSLKNQYKLEIAFEKAVIEKVKISVNLKNANMKTAWENILENTGLEVIMLAEDRLVIRRARAKELSSESIESINEIPQLYSYNGVVKDMESGETIPYATVWIKNKQGEKKGVVANQEGFFNFALKNEQPDSIWASHLGYETGAIPLQKGTDIKEVSLKSTVSYLKEIEVKNTIPGLLAMSGESGQARINPKEISKLPQIGQQDVFRSLQMLPGISISNEKASALHVRGGLPDQNLVLFDGFTVYHLDHLFGFFSSINMNAVKDIRIYKGGFDSKYGGRASSVIDITGKSGNRYEPKIGIGLNLLSAELMAETPIGKNVTALVSLRRSYTDVFQTGLFDRIYNYADAELPTVNESLNRRNDRIEADDFYFYDVHGKLTWHASDKDVVSVSFYRGGDDYLESQSLEWSGVVRSLSENLEEAYSLGNTGAGAKWSRYWNNKLFTTLSVGFSKFEKDYQFNLQSTLTDREEIRDRSFILTRDNFLEERTVRFDTEYQLNTNNQLEFGLFLVDNSISYDDKIIETQKERSLENNATQVGFYMQDTYSPAENLSITAGLRNTWYSGTDQLYVAPRLSLNWKLTDNLTFNASGGRYYQFISQAETALPFSFNQDFWVLAGDNGAQDEEISLLASNHYQAGFLYENNGFTAEVAAYHRNFDGLVRADFFSFMGASNIRSQWEFNEIVSDGKGEANGIDVFISKNWRNYTASVAYSLANVTHQFDFMNRGNEFVADHDQLHELKLMQNLNLGKVHFSTNWVYGSGRPYSQPSEVETQNGRTRIVYTERNNARLPEYHRLDVSVSYPFNIGRSKGEVGASVFNVYNRNNVDNRLFIFDRQNVYRRDSDSTESQLYSYDQFLLGRSLSLFMSLNF